MLCVSVCIYKFETICVWTCVWLDVCVWTSVCVCTCQCYVYVCVFVGACVSVYLYVCVCVCVCVRARVWKSVCVCVCVWPHRKDRGGSEKLTCPWKKEDRHHRSRSADFALLMGEEAKTVTDACFIKKNPHTRLYTFFPSHPSPTITVT